MLKKIKKWFIEAEDSLRIYPLNELAEREIQIHGEGEIYKVDDAYFFWKNKSCLKTILDKIYKINKMKIKKEIKILWILFVLSIKISDKQHQVSKRLDIYNAITE